MISLSPLDEPPFQAGFKDWFTVVIYVCPDRKREISDRYKAGSTPRAFTRSKGTALGPKVSAKDSRVALQVFLTLFPATETFEVDPTTCDVPRS